MMVLAKAASFAQAVGITLQVLTVEPEPADTLPVRTSTREGTLDKQVRAILSHQGITAPVLSVEVRRGAIVPQILAAVSASGADLLAIGYHRGGLPGVIEAGSTARHLAHTAPCAVLTIPL